MIEQEGLVVDLGRGFAEVEIARRSACGACAAASGCGTASLAKLFGSRTSRVRVDDPIGLRVGDRVVIGITDGVLTRASMLAYLLPLIALMLTAFGAQSAGAGEELSALAGMLGLGLGLWVTGRLSRGAAGRERYRPQLLRRITLRPITVAAPRLPNGSM